MKQLDVTTTYQERLWGFVYLAVEILALPFLLAICNQFFRLHFTDTELNFLYFAINFLSVTVIFRRFLLENAKIALQSVPAVLIAAGSGYVLYTASSLAVSAFIRKLYPAFYNFNDGYISAMVKDQYSLMFIGTVILAPVAEELLYRGLIFNGLYNKSRGLAYAVSTLAFAVLHVYGYLDKLSATQFFLCLIEYIPAGLCFGWAYARTGTIITPILIHILNNSAAVLAMR